MRYLRIFSDKKGVDYPLEKQPPVDQILKVWFEIKHGAATVVPTSVYAFENDRQAMEAVAAFFSHRPTKVEKRFGVAIDAEDCRAASIVLDPSTDGTTGVNRVDERHADLRGDLEAFRELVRVIIRKTWVGEQRILLFPAHQILGQIACYAHAAEGVTADAKSNCLDVLSRSEMYHELTPAEAPASVVLKTDLKPPHLPITTDRELTG